MQSLTGFWFGEIEGFWVPHNSGIQMTQQKTRVSVNYINKFVLQVEVALLSLLKYALSLKDCFL